MKMAKGLLNEYVVGGSMLLIGVGFFSIRFADILAFRIGTVPNQVPVIGGAAVTVGRVIGIIPLSIGLSVLASKMFGKTIPIVEDISEAAVGSMDDASRNTVKVNPVAAETDTTMMEEDLIKKRAKKSKKMRKGGNKSISHDTSKPKGRSRDAWKSKRMNAEEEEGEDSEESESFDAEFIQQPAVSGTPAQQLWRECVRDAKGDMALAKQLRDERSL